MIEVHKNLPLDTQLIDKALYELYPNSYKGGVFEENGDAVLYFEGEEPQFELEDILSTHIAIATVTPNIVYLGTVFQIHIVSTYATPGILVQGRLFNPDMSQELDGTFKGVIELTAEFERYRITASNRLVLDIN